MLRIDFLPGAHWVTDEEAAVVKRSARSALDEARSHLPSLPEDLYLLVHQTVMVLPSGSGGFTIGPQVIRWDVDPSRGIAEVAETSMRDTLLHEAHHAARLVSRPDDHHFTTWHNATVFEGLATVFQQQVSGNTQPWQAADSGVMADWMTELFAQPTDARLLNNWRFRHPDGREHILYKVGTWIVERACERSGRSARDLVQASEDEVLEMAGL